MCIRLGLYGVTYCPPALSFLHGKVETPGGVLDVQANCARLYPCPYRGAGNEKSRLRWEAGFNIGKDGLCP